MVCMPSTGKCVPQKNPLSSFGRLEATPSRVETAFEKRTSTLFRVCGFLVLWFLSEADIGNTHTEFIPPFGRQETFERNKLRTLQSPLAENAKVQARPAYIGEDIPWRLAMLGQDGELNAMTCKEQEKTKQRDKRAVWGIFWNHLKSENPLVCQQGLRVYAAVEQKWLEFVKKIEEIRFFGVLFVLIFLNNYLLSPREIYSP